MAALKHKYFGEGEIINRKGKILTVKFKKDGSEKRFSIPESFLNGVFEMDEDLQKEVDAAIGVNKEPPKTEPPKKERKTKEVVENKCIILSPIPYAPSYCYIRKKPARVLKICDSRAS